MYNMLTWSDPPAIDDDIYRSLKQQSRYLQIVNELALALLRVTDMDDILWTVAKTAIAQLGFEDCVIYLLNEAGDGLVQRAAHGPKNPIDHEIFNPIVLPLGQGIVGTVAVSGKAERVVDTRLDGRYVLDDEMRLSELAVPIVHEGQVIGVIDSEHSEVGFYTQEHLDILVTISSIASTRIANAIMLERLAEAVVRLESTREQLCRSEQRYRLLYDGQPTMFFTVDENGFVLSCNDFAAVRLGYPVAQLRMLTLHELHQGSGSETLATRLSQCLAEPGELVRWESCLMTRDRQAVQVRETARAVRLDDRPGYTILIVSEDITDTYKLAQEMRYHASHDDLTGLHNRREFEQQLQHLLLRPAQDDSEHVLLMMDLDLFKLVNDSCGHLAGDEMLRQIARLFQHYARRNDCIARLGGDEFAVLMANCSLDNALATASSIRMAIEQYRFRWQNQVLSVGVSIGVCVIRPEHQAVANVLAQADAACYSAKEAGRNRIHIYSDFDRQIVRRSHEVHWLQRLQTALDRDSFHLFVQPIVPLAATDNDAPMHEILLRMYDHNEPLIFPEKFMSVAGRYNLATRIDRLVIIQLLAWLQKHDDRHSCYTVNLTTATVTDDQFQSFVLAEFEHSGIDPSRICFELSEQTLSDHPDQARQLIERLRQAGCRFAIDDFGNNLLAITQLKNLPLDYLKIDSRCLDNIDTDPVDRALVETFVQLGRLLGLRTVAERVESEPVLDRLRELGVDYVQGFLLAEPKPLADQIDSSV